MNTTNTEARQVLVAQVLILASVMDSSQREHNKRFAAISKIAQTTNDIEHLSVLSDTPNTLTKKPQLSAKKIGKRLVRIVKQKSSKSPF